MIRSQIKQKPPKAKPCPSCKQKFQPIRPLQECCNTVECAVKLVEIKKAKKRLKEKKEHRERKKDLRPMSHWLKETQKVFNEYIRLRDKDEPCISCGCLDAPQWCAGHFRTRGAASNLRFSEQNVHKQCNMYCNQSLSGNIINYRPRLIAKIGLAEVERLENDNSTADWTREGLEQMRKDYRAKIKAMQALDVVLHKPAK